MIEPTGFGSEFKMTWDGEKWYINIDRFNIVGVNGMAELGKEFSQLVLKVFNDKIENGAKQKFKGNI